MSGYSSYNISQTDVAHMDIKDLNRIIKSKKMTSEDGKVLKELRRKLKMRQYGVKNRQRKRDEFYVLEKERENLKVELNELQSEVDELTRLRKDLCIRRGGNEDFIDLIN